MNEVRCSQGKVNPPLSYNLIVVLVHDEHHFRASSHRSSQERVLLAAKSRASFLIAPARIAPQSPTRVNAASTSAALRKGDR